MSFYEKFNPLTTVAKQRFVETFSASTLNGVAWVTSTSYSIGDTVSESGKGYVCLTAHTSGTFATDLSAGKWRESGRWNTRDITGTGTFAMDDTIDGGLKITNGSGATDKSGIAFNDIRQYDPRGCVIIAISKTDNIASDSHLIGLSNNASVLNASDSIYIDPIGATFWRCVTFDNGSATATNSTVNQDTNFHSWKVEGGSSDVKFTIDGGLEVTTTANRPDAKCQPEFTAANASSTSVNVRYCEVYNT